MSLVLVGCRLHFEPVATPMDGAAGDNDVDSALADSLSSDGPPAFLYHLDVESGVVTAPFTLQTGMGATYVLDGNTPGTMGAGSVAFTVIFDRPRTIYIWGNVISADTTTDSFSVTLGGTTWTYDTADCSYSNAWHWTAVRTSVQCPSLAPLQGFPVPSGAMVFTVSSREGGSMLDQLWLTDDASWSPP